MRSCCFKQAEVGPCSLRYGKQLAVRGVGERMQGRHGGRSARGRGGYIAHPSVHYIPDGQEPPSHVEHLVLPHEYAVLVDQRVLVAPRGLWLQTHSVDDLGAGRGGEHVPDAADPAIDFLGLALLDRISARVLRGGRVFCAREGVGGGEDGLAGAESGLARLLFFEFEHLITQSVSQWIRLGRYSFWESSPPGRAPAPRTTSRSPSRSPVARPSRTAGPLSASLNPTTYLLASEGKQRHCLPPPCRCLARLLRK